MEAKKIIKEIDEAYPKVKDLVRFVGMDKGGWIVASLIEAEMGEHKHFIRCENCTFYECGPTQRLKEKFPLIVDIWVTHGCSCKDFSPKPDADGVM